MFGFVLSEAQSVIAQPAERRITREEYIEMYKDDAVINDTILISKRGYYILLFRPASLVV